MPFFATSGCTVAVLLAATTLALPANERPLQATPAQETPSPQQIHSAPMVLVHDKPFVDVMVNGRGPFRFAVDTGTGAQALVTPELADLLGLPSAGQTQLRDPSGLGGKSTPVVLIRSLQVAGVEFTGVTAVRHVFFSEVGSCQGLLGFALFRDYLLTLDFPGRHMTLASGSLAPDQERSVLAFRMPDGVPITALRNGSMEIDALVDSGGTGLSLPEKLASRLKFEADPVAFASGQSLSTSFQIKAARLATDLRLGEFTFQRPFVEIHAAFPMANFGSCPMQSFAITFDQKNLLIRFQSNHKRLSLTATPTAIRLANAPAQRPPMPGLVPVG